MSSTRIFFFPHQSMELIILGDPIKDQVILIYLVIIIIIL